MTTAYHFVADRLREFAAIKAGVPIDEPPADKTAAQ